MTTGFNFNEYESPSSFLGALDLAGKDMTNDPMIKGYAYFRWLKLPSWVLKKFPKAMEFTEANMQGFDGISDIDLTTEAVTSGFAAQEYQVAAGVTKGNTEFQIKFQEFSGSPVRSLFQYWASGIRDPETGLATYVNVNDGQYGARHHTGELLYIQTRPDAHNVDNDNIEFAAIYTSVFPTKIALAQHNYSKGDHGQVEIDIPFKGNFHTSQAVEDLAKKVLKSTMFGFRAMGDYTPNSKSTR
jgi:hypothetical protein